MIHTSQGEIANMTGCKICLTLIHGFVINVEKVIFTFMVSDTNRWATMNVKIKSCFLTNSCMHAKHPQTHTWLKTAANLLMKLNIYFHQNSPRKCVCLCTHVNDKFTERHGGLSWFLDVWVLRVCALTGTCAVCEGDCTSSLCICVLSDTCLCVCVCVRRVIHVHCWAVNHSVHNAGRQHIRQYERCWHYWSRARHG